MATALVGMGGNLGDVLASFRAALRELAGLPETSVAKVARAYRTRALMADPHEPAGPDYWNTAVMLTTCIAPRDFLTALHALEERAGRVRRTRWEARPLDLDLLAYDDVVIDEPGLSLPHPQVASRIFVVAPLVDIAPDWRVRGQSVSQRLNQLDASELLEIRADWRAPDDVGEP